MATLKTNTLTGTTTAGSIAVTGEGNSTTTNLQQGLAKSWVNFNASTGSSRDSNNVASLTDNGTGDFTVNFSNNMNNDDYSFTGSACTTSVQTAIVWCMPEQVSGFLTSSITVTIGYTNPSSSAVADWDGVAVSIHGDLA